MIVKLWHFLSGRHKIVCDSAFLYLNGCAYQITVLGNRKFQTTLGKLYRFC